PRATLARQVRKAPLAPLEPRARLARLSQKEPSASPPRVPHRLLSWATRSRLASRKVIRAQPVFPIPTPTRGASRPSPSAPLRLRWRLPTSDPRPPILCTTRRHDPSPAPLRVYTTLVFRLTTCSEAAPVPWSRRLPAAYR